MNAELKAAYNYDFHWNGVGQLVAVARAQLLPHDKNYAADQSKH